MKGTYHLLNHRTLFTLILSIVIPFLAFEFEVYYHIDLTLMFSNNFSIGFCNKGCSKEEKITSIFKSI